MLSSIASDYTKQDVIKLAQWLIAENACHTNYVSPRYITNSRN